LFELSAESHHPSSRGCECQLLASLKVPLHLTLMELTCFMIRPFLPKYMSSHFSIFNFIYISTVTFHS
jgi:hypothetical protein